MVVFSLIETITTNLESFFIRWSVDEWSLIKFIIFFDIGLKFMSDGELVWSYSRICKTSNSTWHNFREFCFEILYFIVSKFLDSMGYVWIEWTHWCTECINSVKLWIWLDHLEVSQSWIWLIVLLILILNLLNLWQHITLWAIST